MQSSIILNSDNYHEQTYILMIKNALFTYFSKWPQLPQANVYLMIKNALFIYSPKWS